MCRPYCTRYNVYITVLYLMQQIQYVYQCEVIIARDTMCV